MGRQTNSQLFLSYLGALCIFSTVPPCYAWNNIIPGVAAVIFSAIVLFDIIKRGRNKQIGLCLLFLSIYVVYAVLSSFNFNGFLFVLSIPLLVFAKDSFHINVLSAFKNIVAVLLAISIVVYTLVVILNIPIPGAEIKPINDNKLEIYYHYPFLITNFLYGLIVPRFYFLFDEPGVVGTMCALLLVADRFQFKEKINYIFLIGGILSVSFFFFGICGLYVFFNAKTKYKIIVGILVAFAYVLLANNELVNDLVFKRFIIEDGSFVGDNRSTQSFDIFYENFRKSPDYLWGLGAGKGELLNEGGSSYKQYIVDFGVVFFASYLLVFFLVGRLIKMKKRDAAFLLIVVLAVMYQRPFIGLLHWSFLLYSSCVLYVTSNNNNENSINTAYVK